MSEDAFVLDQDWKFRPVEPGELADFAARLMPARLSKEGWMPATVPGNVHTDLVAAGELPDPYAGTNERRCWHVETSEFLYKSTFSLPEAWQKALNGEDQRALLQFESLDTYANIYLNGEFLRDWTNAFTPLTLDVTDRLRPGENTLVVHFESAVKRAAAREQEHGRLEAEHDRTRVYSRRPQYLTGWTNAPRLSGCGLTGRVILRHMDRIRLRHLYVPIQKLTTGSARVSVEADIESFANSPVDIAVTVEMLEPVGSGTNYRSVMVDEKTKSFEVRPGSFRFSHTTSIDHAVLWWPLGYGPEGSARRTLYRARVVARIEGRIVDEQETLFGLRTVEVVEETGMTGFHLRVNGQPVWVRGAVWMPPDMFAGRLEEEDYRRLLDMAATANINLLRVWGGGMYESDWFYRRCDELGIMVWQDFPFTRGNYPDYQAFWQNTQREVQSQVRRLRTHPSLVLWCGNDAREYWMERTAQAGGNKESGERVFSRLIPQALKENDRARPYRRTTPSGGDVPNSERAGDHHTEIWDAWESPKRFRELQARFVSSFGFQSLPGEETIRRFTDAEDKALAHPDFDAHQKQEEGNARILRHVISTVRPPESFEELVYLSQWVQADAISGAVGAWRSRMPDNMGAILWTYNDCWPGISWSVVDHARRPKLAWWALRQAYAPVSLVFEETDEGVRVIAIVEGNKWDGDQKLQCRIKTYKLNGELVDWADREVEPDGNAVSEVGRFSWAELGVREPSECIIVGELFSNRTVIAARLFSPAEPRRMIFEEPKLECYLDCILARQRAVFLVRARNVVRGVELRFEGVPGATVRFDNGFDIWPSREVWVNVTIPADTSRDALLAGLRFRCLNDAVPGRVVHWRELPVAEGEGRAESTPASDSMTLMSRLRTTDVVRKIDE